MSQKRKLLWSLGLALFLGYLVQVTFGYTNIAVLFSEYASQRGSGTDYQNQIVMNSVNAAFGFALIGVVILAFILLEKPLFRILFPVACILVSSARLFTVVFSFVQSKGSPDGYFIATVIFLSMLLISSIFALVYHGRAKIWAILSIIAVAGILLFTIIGATKTLVDLFQQMSSASPAFGTKESIVSTFLALFLYSAQAVLILCALGLRGEDSYLEKVDGK